MAGCKIGYIGNDMEFGVPLLIILGLLFSIWSATFFITGLYELFSWNVHVSMFILIFVTTLTILVSAAFALFYGVKQNNPKLVHSWYILKIIECILFSFGIIISACDMFAFRPKYDWIIGLLLFPFGPYLIACGKRIYKNMTSSSSIYKQMIIETPVVQKV